MIYANEVRGLFKIFGIRLPSSVEQGSFDERVWPLVEADPDFSHALLPLLDARAVLYTTSRELDRCVRQVASRDEACLRFMAIPGVGSITALTFRAAVDDPSPFTSSRTVAAHFGHTPRRNQSGEKDNPGNISKAGGSDVCATLYSTLQRGQRHDDAIYRWIRDQELRSATDASERSPPYRCSRRKKVSSHHASYLGRWHRVPS